MVASLCQALPVCAQAPWADTGTHAHPTGKAIFHEYLPDSETLDIAVVLRLRNRDQLDQRVRAITTRGGPEFGHWMSREQILTDYAPLPERANAVADYLASSGFSNVRIEPGRLLVTATGTAKAI